MVLVNIGAIKLNVPFIKMHGQFFQFFGKISWLHFKCKPGTQTNMQNIVPTLQTLGHIWGMSIWTKCWTKIFLDP